jgi:hypothetical protein
LDRQAYRSGFSRLSGHRLFSYGLAAAGPVASATAQLLLSFQLLHSVNLDAFGTFSFLLIASQLSLGISGAMLCAPYPVLLSKHAAAPDAVATTLFSANLLLSAATGISLALMALLLNAGSGAALAFGAYAAIMVLRWFGRAYAYAHNRAVGVAVSDICYGACLVACVIIIQVSGQQGLAGAYLALLISSIVSLLTFGTGYLLLQFVRVSPSALPAYAAIWRDYARWSLLGVVTTEGTANAHAYIVTLVGGPAAFAPIAASALLIRPVTLAMNALTDYERPQMARLMGAAGNQPKVRSSIKLFRLVLLAVWLGSLLASLALLAWKPRLVFPAEYSLDIIWIGALLWLAIALIRSLRMPESVFLQAAGQFRTLAFASIISCVLSIAIVAVMVVSGAPLWSLIGIAVGEAAFAAGIWHRSIRPMAALSAARLK